MAPFDRTAREFVSNALDAIGEDFDGAMYSILGVYVAAGRGDELTPEEFARFRQEIRGSLDMADLREFTSATLTYATQARTGASMVYRVAWRRSAAQFLRDDIGVEPDAAALEALDDVDDELREKATDIDPVPVEEIPPGIPESHWWWWLGRS